MPNNGWTGPASGLMGGTSVAQNTFTAAKDLPIGDNVTDFPTIFGNTLVEGSTISIDAWGVASNTGTPTLILGVYWGGIAGVALAISTAKTTTTAMANWVWRLEYEIRVVATGTAGSMIGSGIWRLPTSLTAWTEFNLPETAPAPVAVNTTVNKLLTVGATWSASNALNTITAHSMRVRIDF